MLESPPPNKGHGWAIAGWSFPQVWKKLWKTEGFCYLRPENAVVLVFPKGESPEIQAGQAFSGHGFRRPQRSKGPHVAKVAKRLCGKGFIGESG
jgi:hypothetical protein